MDLILYRYIAREILLSTLAVGSVLLLVIVGSRFARFLERVASGRISLDLLGYLTLFYTPYALQIILPISFVVALMLTFGRMYMESEMAVVQSSGVSQRQLLGLVLALSLGMAGLTAVGTLYVTPKAKLASEQLMREQQQRTGFESLTPGQFTRFNNQAVLVEELNSAKNQLHRVFIAQTTQDSSGQNTNSLALATLGYQQVKPETLSRFLILEDGWRYELPGVDLTSSSLKYERYAVRVSTYVRPSVQEQVAMSSTSRLWQADTLAAKVELQWRLGLPAMLVVMAFIALPLTKINPRQGRFMALVPVLLLQLVFLGTLMSLQGIINKGSWPVWPGMWLVHGLFLSLGLLLCWRRGVLHK